MRFCKKILFVLALISYAQAVRSQALVKAQVDHIKNDGIDTQGNIFLDVSGGTSPYTYTWLPGGSNVKDHTNIPAGSYTVTVKDNASAVVQYYYDLGYKTDWYKYYSLMFRNDTLMSNGTASYPTNGTAITKNTLPDSTDGWCEFVTPSFSYPYIFGYLDSIMPSYIGSHYDIDFAFHQTFGSVIYAFSAGSFYYLGTINAGDVVRLDRTGSTYSLSVNGTVLFSDAANLRKLKVKAVINSQPMANLGVSFNDTTYLERLNKIYPLVEHVEPDDVDSLGDIYLSLESGSPPYSFLWNPGLVTSENLIEYPRDTFNVKVKDAVNDSLSLDLRLGYKIHWKTFYGSSESGDTLYAHSAFTPTGSATAIGINELRPYKAGWVQFIAPDFGTPYVLGYLDSNSVASSGDHLDFDFAMHVTYGDNLYAFSSGAFTWLGTCTRGDVMLLEKSGSTFSLSQNGSVLHTDAALNHKNYKVKAMIYQDFYLHHIGASFADSTTGNPLIALADVDHVKGDGIDTAGAISMRMRGGTTPYTYAWIKPGLSTIITKNRNNLALGTYSLRVIDYVADTVSHVYNLGYKADWGNFNGTHLRNDSLLYDGTSMAYGDFPVSITLDSLGNDSAGWAEHVTRSYVSPYVLGFLDSISVTNTRNIYDIDFAYHITTGNTLYAWHSGTFYYIGSVGEGDVMRVGRRDTLYYIQKDSITVYSTTLAITRPLQLKVQLVGPPYVTDWSFLVRTGVNFFKPCSITATITGGPDLYCTPNATLSIVVAGGTPTYNVSWFPNLFFNPPTYNYTMLTTPVTSTVNSSIGLTYYATVTDYYGCVVNRSVNIIPAPYAPLQTTPDGGYYNLTNNKMLFKFDGQYAVTSLAFNVYDKANNNVTGSTSVSNSGVVNSGDNRYYLDATALTSGQYYTLEIINEKNEKRYLRFKR
jgi:hypothetical protein